ncbi:MAG TPA: MFS transporter [Opitutaceae bacterium]|jgi:Na+/melibiose symporter-like transporter|nr:MFS transporter [Opitutaceae bacterium]
MSTPTTRLSRSEKVGYSLGDIATNFFFMSMILYQTRFYTDTVGLSAVAVGSLFLLVRGADAIFDPIVGALSDRTNTRFGRFRPWVLWTALPFGLIFWLVYRSPDTGQTGKLVYAAVTYILVMMLYSANNTPYSALMGVMTADDSERTSISTYRFVAAMIGQFLIQALTLPLVDKLGGGNSAKGWSMTMGIFGAIMVVLYLITFATTKERVLPNPKMKSSIKDDLRDVFTCRPWVMMFLLTLCVFTTLVLRGSSMNYYFAYYLDPAQLRSFLDMVGLGSMGTGQLSWWKQALDALGLIAKPDGSNSASVALSFFLMAGNVIQIVGILLSKPLSDKFGKKAVFLAGMGLSTVVTVIIIFVPPSSINLLFVLSMLWPLGWGPTVPLLWVMIADVADYSEWKNSRRATGFIYAGILFALKAGLGFGGALSAWLLAAFDYVPNTVQSPHALLGIRLCATVFSAVPFVLGLICLAAYPIGRELGAKVQRELAERRALVSTT